jgi:hypothetical protein
MNSFPPTPHLFPQIDDTDRARLQEIAHRLLAQGSILREELAERELYDWCQNRTQLLEEWASLLGLRIVWQREERLILALPEVPSLLKRLRLDETLIILALWYDYDVEIRDRGANEVVFRLKDFNERLANKFNRLRLPSESRMREILRLLERKNLARVTGVADLSATTIRVLPTIRFVIPFSAVEEWTLHAERFNQNLDDKSLAEAGPLEDEDEPQD